MADAATVGERHVDFVVVGFGLGAISVLLGVLLLGWLAGRAERAAAAAPTPAAAAYDRAVAAEIRGAGQAFLYAGGALILATIGGLAGALDDRTGALLIATTATVAVLGIFVWGYLHRSRYPMPSRPRRVRHASKASDVTALAAVAMPSAAAIANADADTGASERGRVDDEADSAVASNGQHEGAIETATATADPRSATGNGSVPAPETGSHLAAVDQAEPRPDPSDPVQVGLQEPAAIAESGAADDMGDVTDNLVVIVATGVRDSGFRPSPDDDDGSEHH
jgi:hypothetical protein